jgi:hypothetical protein
MDSESTWDYFIGTDSSFDQPRTADTVPSNATQSMQPITDASGGWGDFWRGTAQTLIQYGIQRDSVRNGVTAPAVAPLPTTAARASMSPMVMPLLLAALAIGAVYVVVKVAK